MNDRPPPVDHLFLYLDRAGRRGMDRDFERCEVVATTDIIWQFQQAREHRRHQLAIRHPYRSMRRRKSSGSNRSMMMSVPRMRIVMWLRRIQRRRRKIDQAVASGPPGHLRGQWAALTPAGRVPPFS